MAGTIRTRGFGFDRQSMIQAALERMRETAVRENCNCLEIDEVAMRSFWGIPYASVSAHARHIQKGLRAPGPGRK